MERKKKRNTRGYNNVLALAAILLLALALMLPHLGDAFGGFHGMNEAHHATLGKSLLDNPLRHPIKSDGIPQTDLPLTPYLIFLSYSLFGVGEASTRVVPVAFSLLSIIIVYLIGRRAYDERTGLAAAALLAVMPMQVIVGRNAQPDAVFVCLGLAGILLVLQGRWAWAGIAIALSFLAKQPALLFLVGIIIWQMTQRGRPALAGGEIIVFLGAFLAIALPYVAYNLVFDEGGFIGQTTSRMMLVVSEEGNRNGLDMVVNEIHWGLSHLIVVAFAAGVALMCHKMERGDRMVLVFSVLSIVFFIFYNKHGYYILPLAPFGALAAARAISTPKDVRIFPLLALVLVFSGAFESTLMLCANKYGYEEFKRLPYTYDRSEHPQILVGGTIAGSFIDQTIFYNPEASVVNLDKIPTRPGDMIKLDYGRPTYSLIHRTDINIEAQPDAYRRRMNITYSDKYALVIMGYVFYEAPINQHFFTHDPLQVVPGLSPTTFGVMRLDKVPELIMIRFRPDERLFKKADGGFTITSI